MSRGLETSEDGTTLVGGEIATDEVSTAVKTGVNWPDTEEVSIVVKTDVDRSVTEVVGLGMRDGTGVVETSTRMVVNSTSTSISASTCCTCLLTR